MNFKDIQPRADSTKDRLDYANVTKLERERLAAWIRTCFPKKGKFGEISMCAFTGHFGKQWRPRKQIRKRRKPIKPVMADYGGGQHIRTAIYWLKGKCGNRYLERAIRESRDWADGFRK